MKNREEKLVFLSLVICDGLHDMTALPVYLWSGNGNVASVVYVVRYGLV